jgi:asparagine synthase (glutamine-hydrolysing)
VHENQPLVSPDRRLVLVSDARLDNREQLIPALIGKGYLDSPNPTDADLILAAYRCWGDACLQHLLGDFVFALWDAAERCLLLGRDALGSRSLCYQWDGRRCLFASEAGQVLDGSDLPVRINEGKIAEYLENIWDDQEETFFESVYYCPPAHCLRVSDRGLHKRRYWDIDPEARIRYWDEREYAEHFLELLTAAVRSRLRSIGPVGLSLSGGLDSTLVAAIAAGLLPETNLPQEHLKTFSYSFDELRSCDERNYIQPVVDRYQLDATYIPCDDKWTLRDLSNWPMERDFIWSDAFAGLPSAAMKAAQQAGCRVLLNGQFGDALFVGGHYWAADLLYERRFRELGRAYTRHGSQIRWKRDIVNYGLRQLIPPGLKQVYRQLRSDSAGWSNPGLHPGLARRTRLAERKARRRPRSNFTVPGKRARMSALTNSSWAQGWGETRKCHNQYQLEMESPYYDRRLVEYAMALPANQLGRPWRNRWVQRNAMAGLLPEAVSERRSKTTFEPLMQKGLFSGEGVCLKNLLAQARIVEGNFVRADWLTDRLDGKTNSDQENLYLWLFISLELWLRAVKPCNNEYLNTHLFNN